MQLNRGDAKTILLCNSLIAMPALQDMLFYNEIKAIVIPERNKEVADTVKGYLHNNLVPVITVDKKNFNAKIQAAIAEYKPTAVLIMTFPFIIPAETLKLPAKGFINFHYGKLPEYRGPEPIFTQIVQRETKPALTVHIATDGLDNGPVVLQETIPFNEDDTYAMLQFSMALAGARLCELLIKILSFGSIVPATPQDEKMARYHQKPTASDLMLDWHKMDSKTIKALVNACNPWNKGCGTRVNNELIAFTEIDVINEDNSDAKPGTIISADSNSGLRIKTYDDKVIRVNIAFHHQLGYVSGYKLTALKIKAGDVCG